jgi:hypothetical protein
MSELERLAERRLRSRLKWMESKLVQNYPHWGMDRVRVEAMLRLGVADRPDLEEEAVEEEPRPRRRLADLLNSPSNGRRILRQLRRVEQV